MENTVDSDRSYEDYLAILKHSPDLLFEEGHKEEIFSTERLEQYAGYLAKQLVVNKVATKGKSLTPFVKKNAENLLKSYLSLVGVIRSNESFSPAAEWFIDNFHIVEEQLRQIKRNLPNNYYNELPKLSSGELKDFPRVYAIALAIIAHTDSRIDVETLRRFLISFQKTTPLSIGELWAIPITLRIALIERLCPLAARIVKAREKRHAADIFADHLIDLSTKADTNEVSLKEVFSKELSRPGNMDRAYIVRLVQRLREQDPCMGLSFDWLEEKLQTHKTTTHEVIQLDLKRLASVQATVGNIIDAMRLISNLDWRYFFESTSTVDSILQKDPAGVYAQMDFETRDRYRHAIERLAKQSPLTEQEVAQKLIENSESEDSLPQKHIGFFLIDKGKEDFQKQCGYKRKIREIISSLIKKHATLYYIGGIFSLNVVLFALLFPYLRLPQAPLGQLISFYLLSFFVTNELALCIFNHYATFFVKPRRLPRIETKNGLPEDAQSMVVIPTLLLSHKVINELIDSLQVHFLANKDPHIFYALLGDFADAKDQNTETDPQLLSAAEQGIKELNNRYPHPVAEKKYFHLFVRKRLWNESENKWIGWERKRGKLHEFNKLLRTEKETSFIHKSADLSFLKNIKYIITLDSDSRIPRDVARSLIGTILHPLNKPYYNSEKEKLTRGYAILQPRISITHSSSSRSLFSKIFSGNTGLDPYTHAVSDLYQDLFKEAIYTGKGLYVVDAFEEALKDRVPENTLLSHDLFESCYARAGLVTDLELYDDYPSDFESYSKRQHRWTRGDWQLFQWLLPKVPTATNRSTPNPLSVISRWKIFDNLRRSIVPAGLVTWLSLSWFIPTISPLLSTSLFIFVLIFPAYAPLTNSVILRGKGVPWRGHFRNIWQEAKIKFAQAFLNITLLPSLMWIQCDAILRVAYRKLISHKNLLEWVSFAQVEGHISSSSKLKSFLSFSPIFALVVGATVWLQHPNALFFASPLLILWFLSPLIKLKTAEALNTEKVALSLEEKKVLRKYSRKTWHFFESFVSESDNWIAPDNFQEDPKPVVAHRTSPTNIGLQFLATMSAYDLGYVGYLEVLESTERTLNTLEKLSKFQGHLFNWYNTQSLEPLYPQYISTVDSGNLAGHLLVLKQFCSEFSRRPFIHSQVIYGLQDSFQLLEEELDRASKSFDVNGPLDFSHLEENINAILLTLNSAETENVYEWNSLLKSISLNLSRSEDVLTVLNTQLGEENLTELNTWFKICKKQIQEFQRDLSTFSPWVDEEIEMSDREAGLFQRSVPSLSQLFRIAKLVSKEESSPRTAFTRKLSLADLNTKNVFARLEKIQTSVEKIVEEMNFRFLFDEQRKLFVIGYNVTESRRDNSYYDLLASESRLASFIAIAKGDVPQEHWFRLGRQLTNIAGSRTLISWTGTMFEYLMPLLVMRNYGNTLLDQTYNAVIGRQIDYGKENSVPWGISEAGYNARDLQLNFQYGPFGVPGLGLKRGLSEDLVVSPYSTMLALMVDEKSALNNLEALEKANTLARYGFYESIDYTPARLPQGKKSFILRSFMAHHQGMSLVALNNVLHKNIMQRRFHGVATVKATQLLLQEKIPQQTQLTKPRAEEVSRNSPLRVRMSPNPRRYTDSELPTPRTQLLSNGTYSLMITSAGSGYSKYGSIAINRWREDSTQDHWGQFFYIKNCRTNKIWSSGIHPSVEKADKYEVIFTEDRVDFVRKEDKVITHTEVIVSAEDNVELRRISITNLSLGREEFEVTSFMEVALASQADDTAHPAFSNLFIETEFSREENALLATRRQRSEKDKKLWAFHALVVDGVTREPTQYETDRIRFIGRGQTTSTPDVIHKNQKLSGTVGAVLDPIFSLRQKASIASGETLSFLFATGVADTRDDALRLADKYHDKHIFTREVGLSWTKSQAQLRHLNISSDKAHNYQRLAGRLLFSDPSLRPGSPYLSKNTRTQSNLWAYGISGDLPIILVRLSEEKELELVRELLHAHEYLRFKGLVCDLVILNERSTSYVQSLQDELQKHIQMSGANSLIDKPGGVFVRRMDLIPEEDLILLKTVARVTLTGEKGSFQEQITRRPAEPTLPEPHSPSRNKEKYDSPSPSSDNLRFFNGLGGFSSDWKDYIILLKENQKTPAPWINVIANSHDFGFTVSESGSGYTWSENSRENRLTPWSNDPVSDPAGEAIYIRDEESGEFWSPTPLPIREKEDYIIKHTQGYSQFEHSSHGIEQQLQVFVSLSDNVKITRLRLKNTSRRKRKLSVTSYIEWVLGFQKSFTSPFVITEVDQHSAIIYAKNPYNNEFNQRVSFLTFSETNFSFTCDRKTFIGRNGNLAKPAAMTRDELAGISGAGHDPCAALQSHFEIGPDEEKEIIFSLGQANSKEEAHELAIKYKSHALAKLTFKSVINFWDEALSSLQVKTPDESMNALLNKWLLYQTLSCRIWARSAFYQSGGAYGFRDQLQDTLALLYSKPELAREHILRAAARQFPEGDVQHWWHPPTGRGVRTRCSDDLLWLAYVSSLYVKTTGDTSIFDEVIPFIEAPELTEGEDDSYTTPQVSEQKASLREHCIRAIDRSLKIGPHGLPLMGSCDWNDGMSLVGNKGTGESVWVSWFLHKTLELFIPFCNSQDSIEKVDVYRKHMQKLKASTEENAWDGEWYRRAYFDDGTPLGSHQNEECKIDSLTQSWAVLSGAGDKTRSRTAMQAVDKFLVNEKDELIKLFTPPFDKGALNPGYIKGYLPGVRENGGQYTHAAIWTLMAFAELGDLNRAKELFSLINPINHASSSEDVNKYKVEPYVVAADIYGMSPHTGRGGWTWYTGSASWMYRAAIESILGFKIEANKLYLNSRLPDDWPEFSINYRYKKTMYKIKVLRSFDDKASGEASGRKLLLDTEPVRENFIHLEDDGKIHKVELYI
ncbi:MAG: glucoamylase family protein [Bdellovibrionota bacterium]